MVTLRYTDKNNVFLQEIKKTFNNFSNFLWDQINIFLLFFFLIVVLG